MFDSINVIALRHLHAVTFGDYTRCIGYYLFLILLFCCKLIYFTTKRKKSTSDTNQLFIKYRCIYSVKLFVIFLVYIVYTNKPSFNSHTFTLIQLDFTMISPQHIDAWLNHCL